ncbi:unnamed protein product [Urochloa humidicola]
MKVDLSEVPMMPSCPPRRPPCRSPCWTFLAVLYYRDIEQFPVRAAGLETGRLRELLPEAAPEPGESPWRTAWTTCAGTSFRASRTGRAPASWAFFPANASAAGFARDMMSSGLTIVPFTWATSPAAAELEGVIVDGWPRCSACRSGYSFPAAARPSGHHVRCRGVHARRGWIPSAGGGGGAPQKLSSAGVYVHPDKQTAQNGFAICVACRRGKGGAIVDVTWQ